MLHIYNYTLYFKYKSKIGANLMKAKVIFQPKSHTK